MRPRRVYLASAFVLMAAGLVWRLVPMGLPILLLRYGGAVLWGAMVFALVAAARLAGWGPLRCLAAASLIAVAAELFRFVHAPALDAFRGTLAGALIFGRVFSLSNIMAYETGILAAVGMDRMSRRRKGLAAAPRI